MTNLIKATNLCAFYESKKVFENLNFVVQEGDYLCIVGENGSGKTTLMKTILGLDIKHKGSIQLIGFGKREIGYLPQKTQHQKDFPASVYEVVLSGFAGSGIFGLGYSKLQKRKAVKNMQLLGIEGIAEKSFGELSGGQQQKVLLCRALCAAKRVLLLDEPVTSLDESAAQEMYDIINKLNNNGLAVIMISHDVNRAIAVAKHILYLGNNEYFYGNPEEYSDYVKGD